MRQGPRAKQRRHDWIDERSRALAAVIAERVRERPELVGAALEYVRARMEHASPRLRGTLREWERLLIELPLPQLLDFLVEDSERANRLRQSLPFPGVITPEERAEIFRRYEAL